MSFFSYSGEYDIYLYGEDALVNASDSSDATVWHVGGCTEYVVRDYRNAASLEDFNKPAHCAIYLEIDDETGYAKKVLVTITTILTIEKVVENKILILGVSEKALPVRAAYFVALKPSVTDSSKTSFVELVELDENIIRRDFPEINLN